LEASLQRLQTDYADIFFVHWPRRSEPLAETMGVLEALRRELGVDSGETTRDGLFSLEVVACVGACGLAPVISINGEFYGRMVPEKVKEVLDAQVNPAVSAHGGEIVLVDVKGSEIFIEMAGGCQGCALSRMTLKQGVERMVRQAVPEITAVHDVTDHTSGDNPFY